MPESAEFAGNRTAGASQSALSSAYAAGDAVKDFRELPNSREFANRWWMQSEVTRLPRQNVAAIFLRKTIHGTTGPGCAGYVDLDTAAFSGHPATQPENCLSSHETRDLVNLSGFMKSASAPARRVKDDFAVDAMDQ